MLIYNYMNLPSITIDVLIFIAFFLLNIIVGFRYRGKSQSFREYAIGDKQFSTATLTATLVATFTSGSVFFVGLENTYAKGLHYALATLIGATAGTLITGRIVGPRMGKFLDNVSVPSVLEKLYGKYVQLIAGISFVTSSIGYIAVQFKIMAKILAIVFNYESPWIVVIAATIVTLYSLSGGVKAVTFTDVLQFFTFGTLLPILALTIWNHLQDQTQVIHMLNTNPIFSFKEVLKLSPSFWEMMALITYLALPDLTPGLFQRVAMASSTTQVKQSMTWAAFICLGLKLCIIWIAILLLTDQPGLNTNEVVPYMVNTYLYTGLKGLLGIGVMALAMSTADSVINSTAVIIANDILPPLKLQKEGSLKAARNATLFLGGFSVLLALSIQGLLDLILYSASFYAPIVVVPMLMTVFGFQTSRKVILMAMGAGAATVAAYLITFKSVNSFFPGMLANLVTMLSAHYLLKEKGGWGHNKIRDKERERFFRLLQPGWQRALNQKRKFSLRTYLEHALPTKDYFYSLFGFYVFTATYASFYLLPSEITTQFANLYSVMQYSVLLLFTTFLAFPIWPSIMKAKRVLTWLWPLCAFYALFLVGGALVVLSGFAKSQILIFMLNFIMAVLLLHWPIAVTMAISGIVVVGLVFSQQNHLAHTLGDLGTFQFKIAYGLLLSSSFLIALFKHKQAYDLLAQRNRQLSKERKVTQQELAKALSHESRFFAEVTAAGTNVLEAVKKKVVHFAQQTQTLATPTQIPTIRRALEEAHQSLEDTMTYLKNVVYRVQGHLRLEVNYIHIDRLLARAIEVFRAQHTQQQLRPRIHNTTEVQFIQCDAVRIQQLMVNGWLYAQQYGGLQQPVFLGIQATSLGYFIPSIKDYIKEVPALCITISNHRALPQPKPLYMGALGNTDLQIPETAEGLPLLDNQHIVDAHYGTIELVREQDGSLTQIYVIPIHLREVRPDMMDLSQMEVGSLKDIHNEVHPEETALLKRLEAETAVDMALAEKAIMYIKKYHASVKRKSGEPFYLHPIAATNILLDYTEDQSATFATLLHDTIEDTPLTLSEIGVVFGPETAAIVNKVTHLDGQFHKIKLDAYENIRQLLEETDMRVLQVKLADRLHNMRTIEGHSFIEKQKEIAEETLNFFVPMARYLGLKQLEEELQELIATVMERQ